MMKEIIVLLCLGLIGCSTVGKDNKISATSKTPIIYSEREFDDIIAVFSDNIKKNPYPGGAYYNRAIAYFYYQTNYDKCWEDVHKAEAAGFKFDEHFIKALKKASGREE
jgi:hypothetical protein